MFEKICPAAHDEQYAQDLCHCEVTFHLICTFFFSVFSFKMRVTHLYTCRSSVLDAHQNLDAAAASSESLSVGSVLSFSALLEAATNAEFMKVEEATLPHVKKQTSMEIRRQRNRLSCRKTRLRRKMDQMGIAILARQRYKRYQHLVDLRDAFQRCMNPHALIDLKRAFVALNLHYALLDDEYQTHVSTYICHTVFASLIKQWKDVIMDLINVDITTIEFCSDPHTNHFYCTWQLIGIVQSQLQSCIIEKQLIRGETHFSYLDAQVKHIQIQVVEKHLIL